jgi:hypothetical protein
MGFVSTSGEEQRAFKRHGWNIVDRPPFLFP